MPVRLHWQFITFDYTFHSLVEKWGVMFALIWFVVTAAIVLSLYAGLRIAGLRFLIPVDEQRRMLDLPPESDHERRASPES